MKPALKPAAVAAVVSAVAAVVDLAAAAAVAAVAEIAAAVVVAAAAAVEAASANTKITNKKDAGFWPASLLLHLETNYTNSTLGLCGMIPMRYPMSRSFTTASL